MASNLKRLSRD